MLVTNVDFDIHIYVKLAWFGDPYFHEFTSDFCKTWQIFYNRNGEWVHGFFVCSDEKKKIMTSSNFTRMVSSVA